MQLIQIAAENRNLTRLTEFDETVLVHIGDGAVAAAENRQPGDVANFSILK